MGAYLSEPKVECVSDDGEAVKLRYGSSAMQGWRLGMEVNQIPGFRVIPQHFARKYTHHYDGLNELQKGKDGHNCIPHLDDDNAMFAVYDGHGGAEVAVYCSKYLPEYIKNQAGYKEDDLGKALEAAFMKIDAAIKEPAVVEELRHIAGLEQGSDEADAEEASALQEEANLPLGELLARYSYHPTKTRALRKKLDKGDLLSPVVRKKPPPPLADDKLANGPDRDSGDADRGPIPLQLDEEDDSESEIKDQDNGASNTEDSVDEQIREGAGGDANGKVATQGTKCNGDSTTESKKTNGRLEGDDVKDVEDEDEEEGAEEEDEDEEYDDEEEDSDSEDDEEDEADEDDDDDDDDDEEEERLVNLRSQTDDVTLPGSDSGCTAVVAVIRGGRVIVANAGDSRCVLSRAGQAVDLSIDHKPEDKIEITRIEKAGGKVTPDGRVNGGLNLSRAIGDHCYKCNTELPAEEQMISAYPDIQTAELTKDNDFMVVACDGIWNVMTSQEVIDFVRERITKQTSDRKPCKLSEICEELFHACLAPDTSGDGTGCDNMTCIIVQFNRDAPDRPPTIGAKRKASESLMEADEEDDSKRHKL